MFSQSLEKDELQKATERLHTAIEEGNVEKVCALLQEGYLDVNNPDDTGYTPLHYASLHGHVPVVETLLMASANPNAVNEDGETPLHLACSSHTSEIVSALLAGGADVHSRSNNEKKAMHACIKRDEYPEFSNETMKTLRLIVSYGATWDATCDDMVASSQAWKQAPALRLCILLWAQEQADGLELSDIPIEAIERGVDSTQAFIDALKAARVRLFRHKICLVGSSGAGKTSFVKSITSEHLQPQLEHVNDRTNGTISHFLLRFQQPASSRRDIMIHEVTFWDFAGQNAYQVAHSLFFSPRTLFLVVVDLHAFAIAYMQAVIFANEAYQETTLLGEFVEDSISHWIRLILARQPDAEFVFIATKDDVLKDNTVTEILLKDELMKELRDVGMIVEGMKNAARQNKLKEAELKPSSVPENTTVGDASYEPLINYVSCMSPASIRTARTQIEELIIKSKRSLEMPDAFTEVLYAIRMAREEVKALDISEQISRLIVPVDTLPAKLNIEPKLCTNILRILHDLGEVLWYEDLGVPYLQNSVILDPTLVIHFIGEVITHKQAHETMLHSDLKAKPFWRALDDNHTLMEAMKQLMQSIHLVYSASEDHIMRWDSSLIVPAHWQTKPPASWKFLGDILRLSALKGGTKGERVRVRWEFHFAFGLPLALFDHTVVATLSSFFSFDAGPDWILYEDREGFTACRLMVSRDHRSLRQTVNVEAVVAKAASESQVADFWLIFQHLVGAFVGILRVCPGLMAFAYNKDGEVFDLNDILQSAPTLADLSASWMPPLKMWKTFQLQVPRDRGIDPIINALTTVPKILFRRKICLVGSSFAGKTSFVKSITSEHLQPQLEHVDDRTIGIDHFPLRFEQSIASRDETKIHEVTFWDFAGQNAYQVAHSLFFSPRTLFLVVVDLHAFAIAYMQAVIFANEAYQETTLLDEFVEDSISHWIRLILARQPDAEFVFIATKDDVLKDNTVTEILLKDELMKKLRDVGVIVEEMKNAAQQNKLKEAELKLNSLKNEIMRKLRRVGTIVGQMKRMVMQNKKAKADVKNVTTSDKTTVSVPKQEPRIFYVSCTSSESIRTARTQMEEMIITSKGSVEMPDTYTKALEAIVKTREEVKVVDTSDRIHRVIVPVHTLPAKLNIEPKLCTIILQTLHDLGDVLWYEDLDVQHFQNSVILDPLLVIDFVRQVITHKHTGQTMSHNDLKAKPFWRALDDNHTLMEAMKQLMQSFHLVYSASEDHIMRWDSSLIVPAFWQTKTPASWKFLGACLCLKALKGGANSERARVRWEFHFASRLPLALFDHTVVATVSPFVSFDAGPDWILYEDREGFTACRLMVSRDLGRSLRQTVDVEAVVAKAASESQVADFWLIFQHLVGAFIRILRECPGLVVSAYDVQGKEQDLNNLLRSTSPLVGLAVSWMPPLDTWKTFQLPASSGGVVNTQR